MAEIVLNRPRVLAVVGGELSMRAIAFGWLTFALTRPTIPAWTAAASC